MSVVPNDSLNVGWQPFALTGFPNGIVTGAVPQLGIMYQLSSAQLLALQTTAVTLVPAPGVGFYILPKKFALQYDFNATAYTIANADNAFTFEYHGKTTALAAPVATGLVDQTVDTVVAVGPTAAGNLARTNVENLGLDVKLTGTTPALTLGDGTVFVVLEYSLVALQ